MDEAFIKECTDRARKAYLTSLMLTGFIVAFFLVLLIDMYWFLSGTGKFSRSDPIMTDAVVYTKWGLFLATFAIAAIRLFTCATLSRYIKTMAAFNPKSFYTLLSDHLTYKMAVEARERRGKDDAFYEKVDKLLKR